MLIFMIELFLLFFYFIHDLNFASENLFFLSLLYMLMLCYVFMCFSLSVVVLDVFGVLALFSKFYIGVYYTCDCSCTYMYQLSHLLLLSPNGLRCPSQLLL